VRLVGLRNKKSTASLGIEPTAFRFVAQAVKNPQVRLQVEDQDRIHVFITSLAFLAALCLLFNSEIHPVLQCVKQTLPSGHCQLIIMQTATFTSLTLTNPLSACWKYLTSALRFLTSFQLTHERCI
jgi:hypothetical protein